MGHGHHGASRCARSQRSEIRYRQRNFAPDDVVTVQGLPALSPEATVADLFNADTDLRHVGNALRDAAHRRRLDFDRLRVLLAHHYHATNPDVVQAVIDKDLQPLREAVVRLMSKLPQQ